MKLTEIDLYLTEKCNLYCDFCSVKANSRQPAEMGLEKIFEVISAAKKYDLEELHLTGGEPTLRRDLEDIVAYAVKQGLNVRLITNGTLLTRDRLKKLYDSGLRSIMVSIDGLKDYHDRVRGEGTFEKAFHTIDNALELDGFTVRANSVAWKDNRADIIELAKLLNKKGVGIYSIFLGSPLGYGEGSKENVFEPYEWRKFVDELQQTVKGTNFKTEVVVEKGFIFSDEMNEDLSNIEGRGVGCSSIANHFDYFLIRGNGDIYPCVFYSNDASSIGNVNQESLDDLLARYPAQEFYQCVGNIPDDCRQCGYSAKCRGGCRGYAKIYSGQWCDKDPRCGMVNGNGYIPVCPIMKKNLNNGKIGGSSEQALKKE